MKPTCPFPFEEYPTITLAHGGGGRFTRRLVQDLFAPTFENPDLKVEHDSAILPRSPKELAFSTDSHVVSPLFFPGGDIGMLAVWGTVNDLAMSGARPLALSAGFILEEGISTETLHRVLISMRQAADEAGVQIVTGDTKVVEKGHGDGMFINCSGVGEVLIDPPPSPSQVRPGDAVLLSGDIGRHGIAVMAAREGLAFQTELQSDCAPLNALAEVFSAYHLPIHCMRDLTRGGLATALVEILEAANLSLEIDESCIPLEPEVRSACELLGLDPLYCANEGRCVVIVPEGKASTVLTLLQNHAPSGKACQIGTITDATDIPLSARTAMGTRRVLPLLSGEQLPRIC